VKGYFGIISSPHSLEVQAKWICFYSAENTFSTTWNKLFKASATTSVFEWVTCCL